MTFVASLSGRQGRNGDGSEETFISSPLGGGNDGIGRRSEDDPNLVTQPYATVRHLTPVECERLQAWPDGWTNPGGKAPDFRRYAACGDGVTAYRRRVDRSEDHRMVIAGVDLSSFAVDVVILDNHPGCVMPVRWHRFELHGQDAFDRARSVRMSGLTEDWWRDQRVACVGIEDPRGRNPGPIFRVQGAILATIPSSALVQPWIPSQWRKAVGLPGNASKEQVAAKAYLRNASLSSASWPQDACDAFCIALATREAVSS